MVRRAIISAFIAFNIAAILFGSNAPPAEQSAVQRFFYPYLIRTRLLQSWRLFTPSPRKYTLNYRAEITFKDGTITTWRRPYPTNWDFLAAISPITFKNGISRPTIWTRRE